MYSLYKNITCVGILRKVFFALLMVVRVKIRAKGVSKDIWRCIYGAA